MKKILFVSHSAELNGAELWLLETLKRLDRRSYGPSLIVPRPGPLLNAAADLGLETHVVPMKWWITERSRIWRQPFGWIWNLKSVKRIASIIHDRSIDLVFTNSAAMNTGAKAARRTRIPHVWAIHEVLRGPSPFLYYMFGDRALTRYIVKSSARVIVNSEITRAAFPGAANVILIHNGVDIQAGDEGRQNSIRRELGIAAGDLVAGIVGKIYEGKGQREAIRAVAALSRKYPNLKLLVVGEVRNDAYYEGLREIVRENGLDGRVLFVGYHPDLVNVLRVMRVLIVASVVESFGRAALDGMSAGVPVLAVRAGGLPEIIQHGRNGFLIDSREPKEIALALDHLFQNPDEARRAVEGGWTTVREKFSIARQIEGIERVLGETLK
ncbi:MAG: glycosyltransferase family 4 protein [Candidatus Aminicenantes bacterium]|nr:glycosyltransferase family 4 protein [Candidatus Aminicenantes bacterium]